jgi:hypothetical protein
MRTLVVIFGVVVVLHCWVLPPGQVTGVLQALAMLKAAPHPSVDKEQKARRCEPGRAVRVLEFSLAGHTSLPAHSRQAARNPFVRVMCP